MEQTQNQIVLNLASQGQRVLAKLIDFLMFGVIALTLQSVIGLAFGVGMSYFDIDRYSRTNSLSEIFLLMGIMSFLFVITYVLLFIVVPSHVFKGQTFGKKALNIKIVKEDGEEIETLDLIKREVVSILLVFALGVPFVLPLSCCGFVLLALANLVMLFVNDRSKTLYDMIGQTIVVEA